LGPWDHYQALESLGWHTQAELLPGMLAATAPQVKAGLILCDARIFERGVWRVALDSAGTWIVQDLQELKRWANQVGALLALCRADELPLGSNRAAIRRSFHIHLNDKPLDMPEGAPSPPALTLLQELNTALSTTPLAEEAAA
jgi:hypothetical protein